MIGIGETMRPGVYVDFQVYPLRQSGQGRPVGIAAPVEGMADEAPEVVLID